MGRFSEGFDQLVADFFPRREDRRPVGLSEDRAEHRGDHVLVRLGDQREQVAGEVDPTALVRRALQAAAQRRDQPGMLDVALRAATAPVADGVVPDSVRGKPARSGLSSIAVRQQGQGVAA